jgi:hypothetical protein
VFGLAVEMIFTVTVRGISTTWTGTGDWNGTPGNWSGGVPGAGDDAVIASGSVLLTASTPILGSLTMNGGTLTFTNWSTVLYATNVTINSGAKITHGVNSATATNGLGQWVPDARVYIECTNVTVNTNGSINADYVGYASGKGPGASGAGTSHAGAGRRTVNSPYAMPAYNDPAAPDQPGSGGNWSYPANGGSGGGSIRIAAAGTITIMGSISANGKDYTGVHGGGGSGGAIWLSCSTFAGTTNGLISVNGGAGYYYGGPASAGRIALLYNTNAQALLPEPCPRIRFSGKPGAGDTIGAQERSPAFMGTLYLPDTQLLSGPFDIKRFQYARLIVPGFTNWAPASLTLNDCILGLPDGLYLNVPGDLVLTNSASLHLWAAPTNTTVNDYGEVVAVGGSLVIRTNCWLVPSADPTNGAIVKFTVGGNLLVFTGGGIDADDRGFDEKYGPGIIGCGGYAGGGYGGEGGGGFYGSEPRGFVYGRVDGPIQAGSGGKQDKGGKGGGAIRLLVTGDATIDGLLTARGGYGLYAHGAAGSGGGIEIVCSTLHGASTGLLRAEGGWGNYFGANGGGGRIVIRYVPALQASVTPSPRLRFSTFAYTNTTVGQGWAYWAAMGTLYLPDTALLASSPTAATVLDGYRFWHTLLTISNLPTAWSPASLVVSNCVIEFNPGFNLNVAGDVVIGSSTNLPADLAGLKESRLAMRSIPTNTLYGARLDIGGSLIIHTNGGIWPLSSSTNGPAGRTNSIVGIRVANHVIIEPGGGINANGAGYYPMYGNLNGPGAGQSAYNGGASYGGRGGGSYAGAIYGTNGAPFELGSPGAAFYLYNPGKGGGSVHLVAGGNIIMDGLLSANGLPGDYYGGSGGSGGSVFLCGNRLSGSGTLTARGGPMEPNNGHGDGGGGRIAVWYNCFVPMRVEERIAKKDFSVMIYTNVYPGLTTFVTAGGTNAQDGTVGFWEGEAYPPGVLVIMM